MLPNFTWYLPEKLSKCPKIFIIFVRNNNKIQKSRILHDICRKMPEFYMIIARKIFPDFSFGGRARAPCLHRLLRLYEREREFRNFTQQKVTIDNTHKNCALG